MNDKVKQITIKSKFGGPMKVYHGIGRKVMVDGKLFQGEDIEIDMYRGQVVKLEQALN